MRGRAAQHLAFVGSATAFLVGTGIGAAHRTFGFYLLAGFATVASVLAIISVAWMLRPKSASWQGMMSAQKLIENWIEHDVPRRPNEHEFLRSLALRQDEMRTKNDLVLTKLRRLYVVALSSGGVGILLWAALVWSYR
jgi:hypothetical protein